MYKLTKKTLGKKISSAALALILSITGVGCSEEVTCDVQESHVHLYVKNINKDISLQTYYQSEYERWNGYNRLADYIVITKDDERAYKALSNKFDGINNWEYLYYQMENNHDYLKFYWERWEKETETYIDSNGEEKEREIKVHKDGWTTNPNNPDNTGKVKLYHHKYFGYKLIYKNGKYQLEISPLVDDIRDIIWEYPYFSEYCSDTVYEIFYFKKKELKYLEPYGDFNPFNQPDLSTNELYYPYVKNKK